MATKKEVKDNKKIVEKISKKIISLLGSDAVVEVSEDKKNDAILVEIKTDEEAGLLIGPKGDNLRSLQSAIGMLVTQEVGEYVRVLVNVGDWREKQESYLKNLAIKTAERVRETGQAQTLYNLSPYQRRVVHLELSEMDDVETESQGEDLERYLIVKPVSK